MHIMSINQPCYFKSLKFRLGLWGLWTRSFWHGKSQIPSKSILPVVSKLEQADGYHFRALFQGKPGITENCSFPSTSLFFQRFFLLQDTSWSYLSRIYSSARDLLVYTTLSRLQEGYDITQVTICSAPHCLYIIFVKSCYQVWLEAQFCFILILKFTWEEGML